LILAEAEFFPFIITSRRAHRHTQSPTQWVPVALSLSLAVMHLECAADSPQSSNAESYNASGFTATPWQSD